MIELSQPQLAIQLAHSAPRCSHIKVDGTRCAHGPRLQKTKVPA